MSIFQLIRRSGFVKERRMEDRCCNIGDGFGIRKSSYPHLVEHMIYVLVRAERWIKSLIHAWGLNELWFDLTASADSSKTQRTRSRQRERVVRWTTNENGGEEPLDEMTVLIEKRTRAWGGWKDIIYRRGSTGHMNNNTIYLKREMKIIPGRSATSRGDEHKTVSVRMRGVWKW